MTEPLASVTRGRSVGRVGCVSGLGSLLLLTAMLYPAGVWARVAWWFLDSGWTLIDL